MGNFIKEFLDEAIKNKKEEKDKVGTQLDYDILNDKKDEKLVKEEGINTLEDLENYLENEKNNQEIESVSNNLDNLETNMQDKKTQIKIERNKYSKTILWIIIQIVLGIVLITISYSYLQKHEAERKFFDSSIQYWKNIGAMLYSKLGGKFTEQVDDSYIEKRANMVATLSKLSLELDDCMQNEKNKDTLKDLEKIKKDVLQLKNLLSDTSYLPLDKFIQKYQYYSLWVNNLKEGIEKYCNK